MRTICEACEKRSWCVELCDEAEEYVNQDYVPQHENSEIYLDKILYNSVDAEEIEIPDDLTPTERKVFTLLSVGVSRKIIAYVLDMHRNLVRKHISNIVKKNR